MERDRFASRVTLSMPSAVLTSLPQSDVDELKEILDAKVEDGAARARVNVGVSWVVAQLPSAQVLLALNPDYDRLAQFECRLGVPV